MASPLLEIEKSLRASLLTPVFFGAVFATMLFGSTSLQVYRYFSRYTNDLRSEKAFVGALWILDATHLSLSLRVAYHTLVASWSSSQTLLGREHFTFIQMQVVTMFAMIGYIHSLYGIMAWRLRCNVHWALLYFVLSMVLIGHGIIIFSIAETNHIRPSFQFFANFAKTIGASVYISFASATVVDIILASFICFLLLKSRSEFSAPRSSISVFTHYFLASGLMTCLFQVVILVTCATLPGNFAFFGIEMLLPGIHANSYMALKVFRHGLGCTTTPNMLLSEAGMTVHITTLTATSGKPSSKEASICGDPAHFQVEVRKPSLRYEDQALHNSTRHDEVSSVESA